MEKLRNSYKKYQSQVFAEKPRYIAPDKVLQYSKIAQQQIDRMNTNGQYANYEQALFYKQKFSNLYETANKYQKKKITQENYHKNVRQELEKDFFGNRQSVPLSAGLHPNVVNTPYEQQNYRSKSKSPLKDFFDQQEAKNSKKVTFSNLLSANQTPLKYGLRSVSRPKRDQGMSHASDFQLKRLEEQNRKLRRKLQQQKGLHPIDDQRLKQLRNQVRQLDQQNKKLKSQVSKSSRSQFYVEEQYDPYNLRVRQNNIVKINSKNLYQSQKMSQFGGGISEDFHKSKKGSQIYYDNQQDLVRSEFTHNPSPTYSQTRRLNILDNRNNNATQDLLNSSQSTIQTQFLNLQQSQLYDANKNQICRQKIAFFKKSMVLVKGDDFDIAYKRSDFNSQMDRLRLILYINNKDHRKFNCSIDYDYDRQDFEISIKKQLISVDSKSQSRQQIQVYLKNATDLGSLITAKILVGDKMKKIIVPTLFIDFDPQYKYQFQNIGYVERNLAAPLLIKPMSQFSSIDNANNILQLHRQYEQKYQVGKIYGKSKACKGMVKLTWKKGGKLKIDTCQQWRTLMGYLFLNAQQTIHY